MKKKKTRNTMKRHILEHKLLIKLSALLCKRRMKRTKQKTMKKNYYETQLCALMPNNYAK